MRQHACRELRAPGLAGRLPVIVAYEIAIEIERYPGHLGYGVLECRVAAGILPRVEVREAIKWPCVGGRVIEEMGDSEIHATAAGGHLVANRSRKRIGVRLGRGEGLGELNADLHRADCAHRIAIGKQRFAERHPADEILIDLAQLQFRFHGVQPFAIALAVG